MPTIVLERFDGGLNLRDSPTVLKPNETPDAYNWTLDELGSVRLRGGSTNQASLPGTSGRPAFIFFSRVLNQWLCAREVAGAPNSLNLYTRPADLSGSWTNRGVLATSTVASSMRAAFVDWPGTPSKVVFTAGTLSGTVAVSLGTWDGTTFVGGSPSGLFGQALAVWNNRVWLVGFDNVNLFASKIGDPTVWTAPDLLQVGIRDRDSSVLTALGVVGGALLVFKEQSAYAVTDSVSGAYRTIDPTSGAMGPTAFGAQAGRLFTWGRDGLYEWDGVGRGRNIADKARELFDTDSALLGGAPSIAGGTYQDRVLFAYPEAKGGLNNRLLEVSPRHGWVMRHRLRTAGSPASAQSFAAKDGGLYAAVSESDQMWSLFDQDPEAGVEVYGVWYMTPVLEPAGGRVCRIERMTIEGLVEYSTTPGSLVKIYTDGNSATSRMTVNLDADLTASAPSDVVQSAVIQALPHARAYQFRFETVGGQGQVTIRRIILDYTVLGD